MFNTKELCSIVKDFFQNLFGDKIPLRKMSFSEDDGGARSIGLLFGGATPAKVKKSSPSTQQRDDARQQSFREQLGRARSEVVAATVELKQLREAHQSTSALGGTSPSSGGPPGGASSEKVGPVGAVETQLTEESLDMPLQNL
jgi:hypothetical protein